MLLVPLVRLDYQTPRYFFTDLSIDLFRAEQAKSIAIAAEPLVTYSELRIFERFLY